ncbi:MAG: L-seryl-tRNA(Sec) selenium transferase [Pseudomonadota bacterium]
MQEFLRRLPKVDQLLGNPVVAALLPLHPRGLVVTAVRTVLEEARVKILEGRLTGPEELSETVFAARVEERVTSLARPRFRRVVNGTGVIIHTNLGRSLLAEEAQEALRIAARYYSNLEYNLDAGRRGSRYGHVEGLVAELTGAQGALVVNNNAAAVLISLQTLAAGREVIVSRGELVEIGGSFRIPEIMARSGAILREVGATNKTHLEDFREAIGEKTALLLKVHQSNFMMLGFTSQVEGRDLVALAHGAGLPVMEDLGSGSLVDFSKFGLRREPTVQETVGQGLDVITFSGDKLLGGPQAGIIVGTRDIVDRIKKNPLNRAMRIDKFTLAALEATLRLYRDEEKALRQIPTLSMIAVSYAELRRKASRLLRKLQARAGDAVGVSLADGWSRIGGGALPDQELKTRLVVLKPLKMTVNQLEAWFRSLEIPIIGRIENDLFALDVRTMAESDFEPLADALSMLKGMEEK